MYTIIIIATIMVAVPAWTWLLLRRHLTPAQKKFLRDETRTHGRYLKLMDAGHFIPTPVTSTGQVALMVLGPFGKTGAVLLCPDAESSRRVMDCLMQNVERMNGVFDADHR